MRLELGTVEYDVDELMAISDAHFGTVVPDAVGWTQNGQFSYGQRHYEDLADGAEGGEFQIGSRLDHTIDELGVTSIRYPGGTEAWNSFEWRESEQVEDRHGLTDLDRLEQVIEYCGEKGLTFSFTFPARGFADGLEGEVDDITDFITNNILAKAADEGVIIESIKIGNEYNASVNDGDRMAAEDYGDAANHLAPVIGTAIDEFSQSFETDDWLEPDLLIESGVVWNYGGADIPSYHEDLDETSNNGIQDTQDIFDAIDSENAQYIDGVDLHNLTLNVDYATLLGDAPEGNSLEWNSMLDNMQITVDRWNSYNEADDKFSDLSFHSLAWSMPSSESEGGSSLVNAGLPIAQLHAFSLAGIETAYSWAALGFSSNSLSIPTVGSDPSDTYATAGGLATSMAHESILGLSAVEFENDPSSSEMLVHAFAGENSAVVYFSSLTSSEEVIELDMASFISQFDDDDIWSVDIRSLTAEGDPYDYRSISEIQSLASFNSDQLNQAEISFLSSGYSLTEVVINFENPLSDGVNDDQEDGTGTVSSNDGTTFGYEYNETNERYEFALDGTGNTFNEFQFTDQLGDLTVTARGGDDSIRTSFDQDHIFGGGGNDRIHAGGGDDFLHGGRGEDSLNGGTGDDIINGGSQNDTIRSGNGDDVVIGGYGSDYANLGAGNDIYLDNLQTGENANDTVRAGAGNDLIFGGNGEDTLYGDSGRDTLIGGNGDDTLSGGMGLDRFVQNENSGHDIITDFRVGLDILEIEGVSFGFDPEDTDPKLFLTENSFFNGTDLIVQIPNGGSVCLENVKNADGPDQSVDDFFRIFRPFYESGETQEFDIGEETGSNLYANLASEMLDTENDLILDLRSIGVGNELSVDDAVENTQDFIEPLVDNFFDEEFKASGSFNDDDDDDDDDEWDPLL